MLIIFGSLAVIIFNTKPLKTKSFDFVFYFKKTETYF